jgi:hypothetical protein
VPTGVRGARAECPAPWTPALTPAAPPPASVLSSEAAERAGLVGRWSDFYGNLFSATKKYQTVTLPNRQSRSSCFALSPWWNFKIVGPVWLC